MAKYFHVPPPPIALLRLPQPIAVDHSFSLYAGDLHPDVTESDLNLLFSIVSPLHTVHLCRHSFSRKSLCYAFINFLFPFHAADALCRLNHKELRGKPIRIMWCQKDPFLRKTGVGNLFVKNLDIKIRDAKLEEVFGVFGRVLSCKIAKDADGNSKGFGFVQFDSEESASDALSALNGSLLDGKILTVANFIKRSERKEPEFTNVYVKNLDEDFTLTSLKEKFSEYGNITSAVIMHDAKGKSRGFGFVNFEKHENAKMAIEALNGTQIGSKKWFVGKAMMKSARDALLRRTHQKPKLNVSNLFVRNLATSVNEYNLRELFGVYGCVTFTRVICYKDGLSKGMAYVCFSKPQEAIKAMNFLNGFYYHGKYMNVSVALRKEEWEKNLQTLLALQRMTPFRYNVPNIKKYLENKVQKPIGAISCDGSDSGSELQIKSPTISEWDSSV